MMCCVASQSTASRRDASYIFYRIAWCRVVSHRIYLFKQLVSRHNVNRTNKIYTEESQARISHAISKQSVYEIKMFSNYV